MKFTETSIEAQFEFKIYNELNVSTLDEAMQHRVVPVVCIIEDVGEKFGIAMPAFFSSLNKVNLDRKPAPHLEDALLTCVIDIHKALKHVHGRQIYHNDVKPQNILVSQEGGNVLFVRFRVCVQHDHW